MRKPHLVMLAIAALLLLTTVLLWHNREPLSISLLNSILTNGQVEKLGGLQISRKAVSLRDLSIHFDSGAELRVKGATLKKPWGLIFGWNNQSELIIEQVKLRPAESPISTDSTPPATEPEGMTSDSDLRLSDLVSVSVQKLPYKVEIRQLLWGLAPEQQGQFYLARNDSENALELKLLSDNLLGTAIIKEARGQLQLDSQLTNKDGENALNLHGSLTQLGDSLWQLESTAVANLAEIVSLPIPEQLLQYLNNASGNLTLTAAGELPDELLLTEQYRNLTISLQAESLDVVLPGKLIGEELLLSLSTPSPVETTLTSVSPLALAGTSGRAEILIKRGKSSDPMLKAQLESGISAGTGTITANGEIQADQLTPLLQAPVLQAKTKSIGLTAIHGRINFRASADLPQDLLADNLTTAQLKNIVIAVQGNSEVAAEVNKVEPPSTFLTSAGWNAGTVKVSLPDRLTLTSEQWPGALQLNAKELSISAEESKSNLRINATATNLACTLTNEQMCSAEVKAEIKGLELEESEIQVSRITLSSELEINRAQKQAQIALQEALIRASGVALPVLKATQIVLEQPETNCTLSAQELNCKSDRASAELSAVELQQGSVSGTINLGDIQLQEIDNRLSLGISLLSSQLEIQTRDNIRLDTELTGNLSMIGPEFDGAFKLHAGMLTASGNWQHHLETSAGNAVVSLSPAAFSQELPLSSAITGLPLELVAGTLSGKAEIHWPTSLQSKVFMEMGDLAAIYEDIFATGIQGSFTVVSSNDLWLIPKASLLRIQALDVGLPMTEISFTPTLGPGQDLTLENFKARLLEGSLASPALTWNLNGEERRSEITIDGISLRALEKEMEAENFAATGILDLKIPLLTSNEGVTVEHGKVEARAPGGRLRYYGAFSAAMLANNPQLKLLSGALEDYNYRALSGTVEYPPSGDMQMQLKLVGRSDSVAADRDLIINLNLENNIPAMLRSLQASRDLSEALEKQLR